MVAGFEPTTQGPSRAGLVGMPARSLLVEQAVAPDDVELDEELDEDELDELDELHHPDVVDVDDDELEDDDHHCALHTEAVIAVINRQAIPKMSNLRTDFLFMMLPPWMFNVYSLKRVSV